MTENFGVNAEFNINTARAIKSLNEMISVFARIEEQTAGVNNAVSKMAAQAQRDAIKVVQSFQSSTNAATTQSQAIRGLVTQYNALQRAQNNAATKQTGPLASIVALGNQRAAEAQAQAAATVRFNDYVRQSNARVAAAEQASIREVTRTVQRERDAQMRSVQTTAQQENRILNQQAAVRRASSEAQIRYAQQAAAANRQYGDSLQSVTGSLAGTRYALYDVATTFAAVSAATLGASVAVVKVAVDYEAAFSSVARTTEATGARLQELNDDLIRISTTMPVAFGDVTSIATLGAQLGVATENIDEFTTTIAQFSATTNVTTDAAATGIGRLVQLTNKSKGSFDQYASSIYQVGINSVATESEILNIAQQIAVSGNLADFSADQIIGLAGALASLGVRPEAARGSIMRIFNEITKAASDGGETLDQFAHYSSMSAQDFATAWENDPQRAFSAFIEGLGSAAEGGQNLMGILGELGIKAVRDQRAIQLLADNTEVYNQALADSAKAYKDGTALGEGYAITANTISARLKILMQTLLSIANSAGSSVFGVLRPGLEMIQNLVENIAKFANTPIGKVFAAVVISASALVGVLFAVVSGLALANASALAMLQVQRQLSAQTGITTLSLRGLAATMIMVANGGKAAAGGLAATKVAAQTLASSTGVGVAIVAGLMAINAVIENVSKSFETGKQKAENYFGSLDGLGDALKEDSATFEKTGAAFRTITVEVENNRTSLAPWAQSLQTASGAQVELGDTTEQTTRRVQDQVIAIGEATRAWLAQEIANNTKFQETWRENGAAVQAAGFSLEEFLNRSLASAGGGQEYLQGIIDKNNELGASITTLQANGAVLTDTQIAQAEAASKNIDVLSQFYDVVVNTDGAITSMTEKQEWSAAVNQALGVDIDNTAGAVDEFGAAADNAGNELIELVNAEYAMIDGTVGMQNALFALGESLAANGNSFDVFSVGGRANMEALQAVVAAMATASGGDAAVLASNIAGLMESLKQFGVSAASDLIYLQNILNGLTGGKGTAGLKGVETAAVNAGNGLRQGFATGANKATKAAKKTEKAAKQVKEEIVTLSDYVDDLNNVFSKSFDFRFGLDKSLDNVSEGWQKLSDYAADAAEEVQDAAQEIIEADARIRGLNAANETLQYQLTVAQEYGDVLRANDILAEMAENNAELTDAQADRLKSEKALQKAQQAAVPSLDGTTEASREQRDMVLSLLESYQAQVRELANTGMSQEELSRRTQELRQQFVQQMIQMGYSRTETEKYAASFDDLTFAINNVPRNITVSANVDPAHRALDEFLARANNSTANATLTASGGGGAYEASGINVGGGGINTPAVNTSMFSVAEARMIGSPGPSGGSRMIVQSKGGLVPEYRASGGVHGLHPGGPVGTDTVPAWLTPGEFTQRKAAVDYYGLPFMNALNNMQIPKYFSSGGSASGGRSAAASSGPLLVELMPHQVNQIVRGVSSVLSVDGKIIAEATNSSNAGSARRGSN